MRSRVKGNWIRVYERQSDGAWKCIEAIWSDENLVIPPPSEQELHYDTEMTQSQGSKLGLNEKATATDKEHLSSMALLPFVDMSGDKRRLGYGERLLISLRYRLNKIPKLEVANRIVSIESRII